MSELRVALFHPSLTFGGVERVMLNLAKAFLSQGVAVDYVVASGEGEFRDEVPAGARLFDLKSPRVSRSLRGLVRYLRAERPPVLLSAADHANAVAVWARGLSGAPTRVVVSQHTVFSRTPQFASGIRGQVAVKAAQWTYPYADDYVAVSHGVAGDLARVLKIAPEKIHVVYNPIITAELLASAREPVDHPWLRAGEPPVLMSGGRLSDQKDFLMLVRALAKVRERKPARLMIFGEGPERPRIEQLVRELGLQDHVQLPGYVAHPAAWFARAAVFVVSSAWEGFSNVLVEAMAAGTPVVATACEGPREILEDGKYGRLAPIGDAGACAEAILAALAEGKRPLPEHALRRFRVEDVARQYLEVLLPQRSVSCVQDSTTTG